MCSLSLERIRHMVNTIKRMALLPLIVVGLSTGHVRADGGALAIAAGTATAVALASIAETVSARRASARLATEGAGSHLQAVGSNLKQAAIDVGNSLKDSASALKHGIQTGTFAAKETVKAERALCKTQTFFARHGIAVSVLSTLTALLLGGLWLNARQSK